MKEKWKSEKKNQAIRSHGSESSVYESICESNNKNATLIAIILGIHLTVNDYVIENVALMKMRYVVFAVRNMFDTPKHQSTGNW